MKSQASEVLDFVISFLDKELLPPLSDDERSSFETDMERIHCGRRQIKAFVAKRLQ
ncbi:hypothetical protein [Streptomyces sp. NPDC058701]|uniref:hypothetical protein n=1 Tax=Streptomyces sp. NPDC058701 TaxID=3346608 RepID=UPI003663D1AE